MEISDAPINEQNGDDVATGQRAVKGGKEAAEPKKRYGPTRAEPPAAAPVRSKPE